MQKPKIEAFPEEILNMAHTLSGDPTPATQWVHAGKSLSYERESGRYHMKTTEDLITLMITGLGSDVYIRSM